MPAGYRRHLVDKKLEMFVTLMSLKYALSVRLSSCGHFLKLTDEILFALYGKSLPSVL